MSVPRRRGKGTQLEGEVTKDTAKLASNRMHQGRGHTFDVPEGSVGLGVRARQIALGPKSHPWTGQKDLAQRQRQGTIKE
jgi:hypothetical protein